MVGFAGAEIRPGVKLPDLCAYRIVGHPPELSMLIPRLVFIASSFIPQLGGGKENIDSLKQTNKQRKVELRGQWKLSYRAKALYYMRGRGIKKE